MNEKTKQKTNNKNQHCGKEESSSSKGNAVYMESIAKVSLANNEAVNANLYSSNCIDLTKGLMKNDLIDVMKSCKLTMLVLAFSIWQKPPTKHLIGKLCCILNPPYSINIAPLDSSFLKIILEQFAQ